MSEHPNANSHFQQMLHSERVMAEYRRRLQALGYTWHHDSVTVTVPPGAEAARVWAAVNEELSDD